MVCILTVLRTNMSKVSSHSPYQDQYWSCRLHHQTHRSKLQLSTLWYKMTSHMCYCDDGFNLYGESVLIQIVKLT